MRLIFSGEEEVSLSPVDAGQAGKKEAVHEAPSVGSTALPPVKQVGAQQTPTGKYIRRSNSPLSCPKSEKSMLPHCISQNTDSHAYFCDDECLSRASQTKTRILQSPL